jgi:hypothetical protein
VKTYVFSFTLEGSVSQANSIFTLTNGSLLSDQIENGDEFSINVIETKPLRTLIKIRDNEFEGVPTIGEYKSKLYFIELTLIILVFENESYYQESYQNMTVDDSIYLEGDHYIKNSTFTESCTYKSDYTCDARISSLGLNFTTNLLKKVNYKTGWITYVSSKFIVNGTLTSEWKLEIQSNSVDISWDSPWLVFIFGVLIIKNIKQKINCQISSKNRKD